MAKRNNGWRGFDTNNINIELIIAVDSGHFLFELNDRQNSRFVYTTLKSYHKASAQVLSNLRSSSSGFSWTTDTHISPGFLLSWFFDPRSFDPNSVGFLSISSNIIDRFFFNFCHKRSVRGRAKN